MFAVSVWGEAEEREGERTEVLLMRARLGGERHTRGNQLHCRHF